MIYMKQDSKGRWMDLSFAVERGIVVLLSFCSIILYGALIAFLL